MTTTEKIFGTQLCPVNLHELSRITGIGPSTLWRWRNNPDLIPWGKMKLLIKVRGLSSDDLMKMVKEKTK